MTRGGACTLRSLVTTSVSLTEALLFLSSSLHFDQLQAAISVNLHRYISTTLLQPLFHPAATSRSSASCYLCESATGSRDSKIGGTVAHLRRCMGRRTSARGISDIEGELTLGTSSAAYFLDAWWYKT